MSVPRVCRGLIIVFVVSVLLLPSSYVSPTIAEGAWIRVIVRGHSLVDARAAVLRLGGEVEADIPIITSVVARVQAARLSDLRAAMGVVRVTRDRPVRLTATRADMLESSSVVNVEFPKAIGVQEV